MAGTDLNLHPIHLGQSAAVATVEPAFTGMEWYQDYTKRHASDGPEGRLVSMYSFTSPWGAWEMHPNGSEVVICTAGAMTLHQQCPDGTSRSVRLGPGEYAINEPGTWHTADVETSATAVFITAGWGTQHRPR
jgi:quercetin dioxygenase-like cupin family protein